MSNRYVINMDKFLEKYKDTTEQLRTNVETADDPHEKIYNMAIEMAFARVSNLILCSIEKE